MKVGVEEEGGRGGLKLRRRFAMCCSPRIGRCVCVRLCVVCVIVLDVRRLRVYGLRCVCLLVFASF